MLPFREIVIEVGERWRVGVLHLWCGVKAYYPVICIQSLSFFFFLCSWVAPPFTCTSLLSYPLASWYILSSPAFIFFPWPPLDLSFSCHIFAFPFSLRFLYIYFIWVGTWLLLGCGSGRWIGNSGIIYN